MEQKQSESSSACFGINNNNNASSFSDFQQLEAALKSQTFKQMQQMKTHEIRSRQTDCNFKRGKFGTKDLQFRFVPGITAYLPSPVERTRRRTFISHDPNHRLDYTAGQMQMNTAGD